MSEGFLTRWSRRKRKAEEGGEPETAQAAAAPDTEEGKAAIEAPAFDPESLPPLESIAADSDIRAFLGPAIPTALKHAAMRRAWAADPAIRDFIGLSENAWDFNTPGAVPGFGTLEPAEIERLARAFLASGSEQAREQERTPVPQAPLAVDDSPASKAAPAIAQAGDSEPRQALSQCSEVDVAVQQDVPDVADPEPVEVVDRPRGHGRALPQ